MKKITSDALGLVSKVLGVAGAGAQETELTDGTLGQNLDVTPIIRRGRTHGQSEGIYTAVLRNIHGSAETLVTTVDPFDVTTGRIAPYPGPMPDAFDIWLLAATIRQQTGTGTMVATLSIAVSGDPPSQGWGINDSGVAVVATPSMQIGFWDSVVTVGGPEFGITEQGAPMVKVGLRLRRGWSVVFESVSSAVATFQMSLILGVFPAALGQDISV